MLPLKDCKVIVTLIRGDGKEILLPITHPEERFKYGRKGIWTTLYQQVLFLLGNRKTLC